MKRIYLLYIALVATIITASAQTSTPPQAERRQHVQALPLARRPVRATLAQARTGGVGGGLEGAFWTCPDTIRPATITIDQDFPNTAPGFVDPNSVRVQEQGNYSFTIHNKNYGQTLVGGHGYRSTLDASEPILMVATDHYRDFYFVALPGQHLHFVYDFSNVDVITEAYEECADGTTKPLTNLRDIAPAFIEENFNTFDNGISLPSAYINSLLVEHATNPNVAQRWLQSSIDRLYTNAPKGISFKSSQYMFVLSTSDPLIDKDAPADSTASTGSITPIYRKEQGGLDRFVSDLNENFKLADEDSLLERGACTLWIEIDPKGNLASHRIFHSISPTFDAALTEALLPLFPFDVPARTSGKACRFRMAYNVVYSKHGEAPVTRAASANPLSVFQPFIDVFTLTDVEIPLAIKLTHARVSEEELLPQRIVADYGDFVRQEPGEPSLTALGKAHDDEPFATWFQQLYDRQKACLEMSPLERQRIAKDLANTIDDYRSKNHHLPMFCWTIDTKFNGDSRRYVDHIFKTSLLFNRQRLNRFYEDLDHAHLFEDEGFNFLISILDFAKRLE